MNADRDYTGPAKLAQDGAPYPTNDDEARERFHAIYRAERAKQARLVQARAELDFVTRILATSSRTLKMQVWLFFRDLRDALEDELGITDAARS